MKRKLIVAAVAFVTWTGAGLAHDCPYEWNIKLTKGITFKETSLSNAVDQINAAVREATKGRIQRAIILDTTPTTITKGTADPDTAREMDVLIERYKKEIVPIIARGAQGYETCPVTEDIIPNFPLACQIAGMAATTEMGYEEKKDGAVFSRWPKALECRAYKVSDALLNRVEEQRRAGKIHRDFQPVPVVFAQESGMKWTAMVRDGPRSFRGDFILEAVTLYLPDKRVMLILETPQAHKKVQENLQRLGYWQEQ